MGATIPEGATITAATMKVNIVSGTSTAYNAKASQVTGSWESATIQWSNMPTIGAVLENNISHNNKTKYEFSCLTAVQHWYTNSTTGQNENYGIMLQYADNTIADYNSFYSADCTDAASRPSMTISYTQSGSSYSVNEGETLTLTIARTTETITWTSSDSTVASVNSNGLVTGIKAGEVTIRAYANGEEYQTYTVYVTVVNGVYRICYGTNYYLGTSGGVTNNTLVRLSGYASSGVDLLNQLWKITYLGDGYYSIRPLHKLSMGLHAGGNVGTSADIVTMGMSDTLMGILLINRWGITKNDDGDAYYLNHVGTSSLGLKPNGDSPAVGMDITIAQNPGDDVFDWSLQRVTGVYLHDTTGNPLDITAPINAELEMGGTYKTSLMGFFVTTSNVNLTWESSAPSKIAVDAQGKVTTRKRGVANITASGTAAGKQFSLNVKVTSIETVYVKNFYDSTYSGNTEKISKIYDAVSFLDLVYYDEFQLKFVMDGPPVQYERAGIDICPNGVNDCNSTCGSSCKSHHKNVFRIAEELYNEYFDANHIVVLWSDSIAANYCGSRSDLHFPCFAMSAVVSLEGHLLPIVQMFYNDPDKEIESMSINLAHEVAHTLGLKEIYNNDYEDDSIVNGTPWHDNDETGMCIMKSYETIDVSDLYRQTLADEASALCDYCIGKLHTEAIQDRDLYES